MVCPFRIITEPEFEDTHQSSKEFISDIKVKIGMELIKWVNNDVLKNIKSV